MNHAIETSSINRRFGTITAVNDLALRVPEGSVYGFLGHNGAGKTTTIRMLLGLIRPDEGAIRVFGMNLEQDRIPILGRVGSLVETPSLYPHLTGKENLEVIRQLLNLPESEISRVLSIVHLQADAHRPVRNYSLGMKQRLGLAGALLGNPDLLILDEPTNGLDPAGILEMRTLLQRMPAEFGITVFLSSHLLSEVEQIATHIGILNKGSLVFQGTIGELRERRQERLAIETEDAAGAAAILDHNGWKIVRVGKGTLDVRISRKADAATINELLVRNGVPVFRLTAGHSSLEETFLNLTTEETKGS